MTTDLSKLTLDELQKSFIDFGDQLSVIAESRREVYEEIKARLSKAVATARIDGMSDGDKDALMVVLSADVAARAPLAMSPVSPL